MTEWTLAHPWLTFFVALAAASAIANVFRPRIIIVQRGQDDES